MAIRRAVVQPAVPGGPARRRVGRVPGQPRISVENQWSSRAGGRLVPGVPGRGAGWLPGGGQWDLVGGRRVDVAASAQQRRDRGDRGQGGGHAEHHGQAVLERPGYQFREELPAGEDPLAGGRERRQRAAGRQQVLNRVHAEHRREQRRHRRQGADLVGDAVRHAQPLQTARQRPGKAARQTDDHE